MDNSGWIPGLVLAAATVASTLAGCGPDGPSCDRAVIEDALRAAAEGETVEIGACEVEGPLHVPPGVTLAGTEGTVVVAPEDSGAILALGGAATATEVRDLRVRVEGRIGILARGGGAVRVVDVTIDAERGIGLGASELSALELTRVTLAGPIDGANANDAAWVRVAAAPADPGECPDPSDCECTPGEVDAAAGEVCDASGHWATWTATYGLYASGIESATFTELDVSGFARWGVVLADCETTWEGGSVADTLGIGIQEVGGSLAMSGVSVEHTYGGLRGDRPYGLVASEGASLIGTGLVVRDNDRFGVLVSESTGSLVDLVAEDNGDAAVWVSASDAFELSGTATRILGNAFAGLVVVGSSGVTVADGSIEATATSERPVGALGVLEVGDGIHVVDSLSAVRFRDLALRNNGRAGLALDLGSAGDADVTFSGVTVEGTGAQLGAIAGQVSSAGQLAVAPRAGWDDGITRAGAVVANDPALTGAIHAITESLPSALPDPADAVAVVAPMF